MTTQRLSLSVFLLGVFSHSALGAGLELNQHGVKEMGHGFAGTAAMLEDASAIAHNPAGLLRLEGTQASGALSAIYADIDYDTVVRRQRLEEEYGLEPTEVDGPGSANSRDITMVPALYYSHRINDEAAAGIGIYAPFGSGSDFPDGWAGRYHAEETSQTTLNINPTFAFQATDSLSVGMGVVIQMYEATLTNQIDLGYLVAESALEQVAEQEGDAAAEAAAEDVIRELGEESNHDVQNDIEIDSIAYGFSFGVLWEPSERTRIGLNYRSRTSHIAEGEAKRPQVNDPQFRENLQGQVQSLTNLSDDEAEEALNAAFDERGAMGGDLNSRVTFPEVATLSGYHELTERMAIMGSISYINWSVFEEIRLEYTDESTRGGDDITGTGDDVRRRDLVQPLEFEDAWRYGLGLRYQATDRMVFRFGASYDESPLTDSDNRTPRGPDNDRYIAGLGLSYSVTDRLGVDVAYAYTRITEGDVTVQENPAGTQHRTDGSTSSHLHSAGIQANYRF